MVQNNNVMPTLTVSASYTLWEQAVYPHTVPYVSMGKKQSIFILFDPGSLDKSIFFPVSDWTPPIKTARTDK